VWLACVTQTICEDLEMRIVMTRDESSLEHNVSYLSPSATNGALAAHRTAVVSNGSQARERSSLFSRELAQFWHFRDQHSAGNGADPRDRTQDTSGLCKALICGDGLRNLIFQFTDLSVQQRPQLSINFSEYLIRSQLLMRLDLRQKSLARLDKLRTL